MKFNLQNIAHAIYNKLNKKVPIFIANNILMGDRKFYRLSLETHNKIKNEI